MKTKTYILILIATIAASCTSLQQSTVNDDIYYSPKDQVIVENKISANNLQEKNSSTIFGNNYDKQIADILGDESMEEIDTTIIDNSESGSYESIIVDDYSEAMDRRIEARNSPYYGTTNYLITTTNAYWAAMIYANDPYYNVIIIGDQVWVEPRYITSSFGYWPNRSYYSYYYDPFYFGYSPYYSYYSPYYYNYYSPHYYHPYYDPYYYYNPYKTYYSVNNDNYASSSFHSYRQRTLSTNSATRSSAQRTSRALPETYAGRDISRSSTVKSGLDRQSVSTERNPRTTTRTRSDDVVTPRIVTESSRTRTSSSSANRNYTRPQSTSRSTYNATTRSTSRYSRPASTNESSNRGQSTSRSTYTPNKNATSNSRSGSTYRSSGSSSSRSSGSSSRSSVRSSSSSSSSGRSSGSSGSSGRSSGSSSRSGGGRR